MKFTGSLAKRRKYHILGLIVFWIVYHNGGTIPRQDAKRKLEAILDKVLEPRDIELVDDNIRERWFKDVDAVVQPLRRDGYLSPASGRGGEWEITRKGSERVEILKTGRPDPVSGITLAELRQNLNFPDDDGNIPSPSVLSQATPGVVPPSLETEIADPPRESNILLPYFAKKGYQFTQFQIATFYSALKTKGFVILSGLSGTGKTKLAQHFGELFGDDCVWFESVRPDWRDSKNLIGFVNPLLDGKYQSTGLLRFLLRARDNALSADATQVFPHFLILDEMNLAHVEYYFAEFLSVLESGRITQADVEKREVESDYRVGFTREPIHLHSGNAPIQDANSGTPIPSSLRLPPNLYIIGTVNVDETTFAFSPKVLDRAFTIEFRDADLGKYNPIDVDESEANQITEKIRTGIHADFTRGGKFIASGKEDIANALDGLGERKDRLVELGKALEPYDLHFGYRVLDEIALFFVNALEAQDAGVIEFDSDDAILDAAVLMKVLPKIHGSRQKLEEPLTRVLRWTLAERTGNTRSADVLQQIDGENIQRNDIPALLERWSDIVSRFAYPETAKKVLRMLHALYATGFASFA